MPTQQQLSIPQVIQPTSRVELNPFVPTQQTSRMQSAPIGSPFWDAILKRQEGDRRFAAEQAVSSQQAEAKLADEAEAKTASAKKDGATRKVLMNRHGYTEEQAKNWVSAGLEIPTKQEGKWSRQVTEVDGRMLEVLVEAGSGNVKRRDLGAAPVSKASGGSGGSGGGSSKKPADFFKSTTNQNHLRNSIASAFETEMVEDVDASGNVIQRMKLKNVGDNEKVEKMSQIAIQLHRESGGGDANMFRLKSLASRVADGSLAEGDALKILKAQRMKEGMRLPQSQLLPLVVPQAADEIITADTSEAYGQSLLDSANQGTLGVPEGTSPVEVPQTPPAWRTLKAGANLENGIHKDSITGQRVEVIDGQFRVL